MQCKTTATTKTANNQNWNQTVYSFLWDGILVMHEYS